MRVSVVQLTNFSVGPPPQIAGSSIPQISARYRLEAARRIEIRGKLVREALVLDEALLPGGPDGRFVEALGIELPAFDPRDLGADQRGAVLEIFGAIRRPDLQLPMMRSDSVYVLLSLAGRRGVAIGGSRQRGIKVMLGFLQVRR